jgi:hypothetical protein
VAKRAARLYQSSSTAQVESVWLIR